jgi:hypothetical protein
MGSENVGFTDCHITESGKYLNFIIFVFVIYLKTLSQ